MLAYEALLGWEEDSSVCFHCQKYLVDIGLGAMGTMRSAVESILEKPFKKVFLSTISSSSQLSYFLAFFSYWLFSNCQVASQLLMVN